MGLLLCFTTFLRFIADDASASVVLFVLFHVLMLVWAFEHQMSFNTSMLIHYRRKRSGVSPSAHCCPVIAFNVTHWRCTWTRGSVISKFFRTICMKTRRYYSGIILEWNSIPISVWRKMACKDLFQNSTIKFYTLRKLKKFEIHY